jgi:hypothetical protein
MAARARRAIAVPSRRPSAAAAVSAQAALAANQLDRILAEIGPAIAALPGGDLRVARVADSLTAVGLGRPPPADAEEPAAMVTTGWPHPAFTWMWPMLLAAEPAGEEVTAEQRYAGAVATRRAAGTIAGLTVAPANLALAEAAMGQWVDAIGNATRACGSPGTPARRPPRPTSWSCWRLWPPTRAAEKTAGS